MLKDKWYKGNESMDSKNQKEIYEAFNKIKLIAKQEKKKQPWEKNMMLSEKLKQDFLNNIKSSELEEVFDKTKEFFDHKKKVQEWKGEFNIIHREGKRTLKTAPRKDLLVNMVKNLDDKFSPIFELIDNSLDAIAEERTEDKDYEIRVIFEKFDDHDQLTIVDNGGGMDEKRVKALVQLGYSLHETLDEDITVIGT